MDSTSLPGVVRISAALPGHAHLVPRPPPPHRPGCGGGGVPAKILLQGVDDSVRAILNWLNGRNKTLLSGPLRRIRLFENQETGEWGPRFVGDKLQDGRIIIELVVESGLCSIAAGLESLTCPGQKQSGAWRKLHFTSPAVFDECTLK